MRCEAGKNDSGDLEAIDSCGSNGDVGFSAFAIIPR